MFLSSCFSSIGACSSIIGQQITNIVVFESTKAHEAGPIRTFFPASYQHAFFSRQRRCPPLVREYPHSFQHPPFLLTAMSSLPMLIGTTIGMTMLFFTLADRSCSFSMDSQPTVAIGATSKAGQLPFSLKWVTTAAYSWKRGAATSLVGLRVRTRFRCVATLCSLRFVHSCHSIFCLPSFASFHSLPSFHSTSFVKAIGLHPRLLPLIFLCATLPRARSNSSLNNVSSLIFAHFFIATSS